MTGPLAPRVVVAADAADYKKGARLRHWTHLRCEGSEGSEGSKGSEGKVLKMDGPSAQGFLSLTALRAEGCGGGFAAIFKVSVTGLAVCVICNTISSATYFLVSP